MTLWKESTNVLPADGATVWVRRFPGIEHPKQALFSALPNTAPTFTVVVNAPDTSNPVELIIPCSQIHSWRPVTGPSPGPGGCAAQEAAESPIGTAIPGFIGQLYHDSSADSYYRSTGLTSADWTNIGGGAPPVLTTVPPGYEDDFGMCSIYGFAGPSSIVWLGTRCLGSILITQNGSLLSADFPNLTHAGSFDIGANSMINTITAPLLTTIDHELAIGNSAALTTLDLSSLQTAYLVSVTSLTSLTAVNLPALLTTNGAFLLSNNPALTSINVPSWNVSNGMTINCSGCALDQTSIELILARCVAASVTSCTIDLSGGSNAGLTTLSTQGQSDYATLVAAGNTVTLNP